MLMFNNGGVGMNSMAYELMLDLNAHTATRVWTYDGGSSSFVLGDIQRLSNGNTLVTYSIEGKIVELDPDWNEVQTFSVRVGSLFQPSYCRPQSTNQASATVGKVRLIMRSR